MKNIVSSTPKRKVSEQHHSRNPSEFIPTGSRPAGTTAEFLKYLSLQEKEKEEYNRKMKEKMQKIAQVKAESLNESLKNEIQKNESSYDSTGTKKYHSKLDILTETTKSENLFGHGKELNKNSKTNSSTRSSSNLSLGSRVGVCCLYSCQAVLIVAFMFLILMIAFVLLLSVDKKNNPEFYSPRFEKPW